MRNLTIWEVIPEPPEVATPGAPVSIEAREGTPESPETATPGAPISIEAREGMAESPETATPGAPVSIEARAAAPAPNDAAAVMNAVMSMSANALALNLCGIWFLLSKRKLGAPKPTCRKDTTFRLSQNEQKVNLLLRSKSKRIGLRFAWQMRNEQSQPYPRGVRLIGRVITKVVPPPGPLRTSMEPP